MSRCPYKVDDFLYAYLQPAVQGPLNCDAFTGMRAVSRDRCYQRIQLIALFFQLLHQGLDGALGEPLTLPTLPVAHQRVNDAEARVRRRRGCCVHG